jgi:hypothetical protein
MEAQITHREEEDLDKEDVGIKENIVRVFPDKSGGR